MNKPHDIGHRELTSGYSISRVIKGGWQLSAGHTPGGTFERGKAIADMQTFVDSGITTFDFGDIYLGVEELIGEYIRSLFKKYGQAARASVQLHSKYVPDRNTLPSHAEQDVRSIIGRSLRRLGIDQIDLVQFHWWDYDVPGYIDAMRHLERLRDEGKIRLLGVTNFDVPRMQEFVDAGVKPSAIQLQYSLLDRRPEGGMIDFCGKNEIGILCYGTVAGGFLSERFLDTPEPRPPFETRSMVKYKLIIDEFGGWNLFQELLHVLKTIADRHATGIATIASAYILQKPGVAAVIVGARNALHAKENASIPEVRLRTQDILAIEAVLQKSTGPQGDVYDLERHSDRHASIMHTFNNAKK